MKADRASTLPQSAATASSTQPATVEQWSAAIQSARNRTVEAIETAGAHWFRYSEIQSFVNRCRRQLTRRGLIRRDVADMVNISEALALAEVPYSRKQKAGDRTFDLPAVLRRVTEIEKGGKGNVTPRRP